MGEYKNKIFLEFFDKGFRTPNIKNARSLLNDYKKFGSSERILNLTLWFVECGTGYVVDFGDMYQAYYDTLCKVYDEFLTLYYSMETTELSLKYKKRIQEFVSMAYGIAWGYGEYIIEVSGDFYGEDEEDEEE